MKFNPHPHFHLAITDGLFARRRDGLTFHPARRLDSDTARSVTPLLRIRILRLYVRRGLLSRAEADDMLRWRGLWDGRGIVWSGPPSTLTRSRKAPWRSRRERE